MNELQRRRKALEITQVQAAKACGVSRRTFQNYEESENINETYDLLIRKLEDLGIIDGENYICNIKQIKKACKEVFTEKYLEVKCAYLFGSYARGEATKKSDVDLYLDKGDIKSLFDLVDFKEELECALNKKVDIVTVGSQMNYFFKQQLEKEMIKLL